MNSLELEPPGKRGPGPRRLSQLLLGMGVGTMMAFFFGIVAIWIAFRNASGVSAQQRAGRRVFGQRAGNRQHFLGRNLPDHRACLRVDESEHGPADGIVEFEGQFAAFFCQPAIGLDGRRGGLQPVSHQQQDMEAHRPP